MTADIGGVTVQSHWRFVIYSPARRQKIGQASSLKAAQDCLLRDRLAYQKMGQESDARIYRRQAGCWMPT